MRYEVYTTPATPVTRRRNGFVSVSTLLLLIVAFGCAALVGQRVVERQSQTDLASAMVRDTSGKLVPLVPKGQPTVVMVSSRTCPWCKKALADFGRFAAKGDSIPGLTLFTLEGAADGVPMLAKEKLRGARIVGPAGSREDADKLFRNPGTPTFLEFDRSGRLVYTLPGYPIGTELERLFAIMSRKSE